MIFAVDKRGVPVWGILALDPLGTKVTMKALSTSSSLKVKEDSWELPVKVCGLWTAHSHSGTFKKLIILHNYYFYHNS